MIYCYMWNSDTTRMFTLFVEPQLFIYVCTLKHLSDLVSELELGEPFDLFQLDSVVSANGQAFGRTRATRVRLGGEFNSTDRVKQTNE